MSKFVKPIEIHDHLNPKLWDGDNLRPEVSNALLKIAKVFYEFLEVSAPVVDILVEGSQANYNYTEYSDLDLHLIIDFKEISCDEPIAELFNAKRKLWKEQHSIDIYGIPVELYVEDVDQLRKSSSYSLVNGDWVDHPDMPKISYNIDKVKQLVGLWQRLFVKAMSTGNLKLCRRIFNLLSNYRKIGLAKHGEFGVPNLVFKSLRNMGMIDQMTHVIQSLEDNELSLD